MKNAQELALKIQKEYCLNMLAKVSAQRDELLVACKLAFAHLNNRPEDETLEKILLKAIAKAEGKEEKDAS